MKPLFIILLLLQSSLLGQLEKDRQSDLISNSLKSNEHTTMQGNHYKDTLHSHISPSNNLHPKYSQKLPFIMRHPEKHQCSICQVPLKNLTKIFAILKSDSAVLEKSQEVWIVCVPCLAGWSTSKIDIDSVAKKKYKIWICKSLNKKIEIDQSKQMTISECLEMLSCAQKYGPFVNNRFQAQFYQRTGSNLSQSEIEERYMKMRQSLFDSQEDLTFLYPIGFVQNIEAEDVIQVPKPINIVQNLSIKRQEEINEAELFFNLLQYHNPVEHFSKYPDNHADFMFRAFSTNNISKKLMCQNRIQNLQAFDQKTTLIYCLTEYAEQKNQIQNLHKDLNKKYCEKYIQMKRAGKSQIPTQDNESKLLHNLQHPQVSKLIKDQQLSGMFSAIVKLKKQRNEIMNQVRERKKYLQAVRRNERRQTTRQKKSVQMESRQEDEKNIRAGEAQDSGQDN